MAKPSISKVQAEALAEGFFDDIGVGKDEFRPKETISELLLLAGELIEDAQNNLNNSKNNASGKLSESIQAREPIRKGSAIQVDIEMLYYGQFQNKGVKGVNSGSSKAGYSFKNMGVGKKMLKALQDWINRGKLSTRTVRGSYKSYGKGEAKNYKISELSSAFALAKSIKSHGVKATGFMDKAIQKTSDKIKDRLGDALAVDIINMLPDELGN